MVGNSADVLSGAFVNFLAGGVGRAGISFVGWWEDRVRGTGGGHFVVWMRTFSGWDSWSFGG